MIKSSFLLNEFTSYLSKKGKTQATISSYKSDANCFLDYLKNTNCELNSLEESAISLYQVYLNEQPQDKLNSIRRKIIGVRQFFRFLESSGTIKQSPFESHPIPPRSEDLPAETSFETIQRLLAAALKDQNTTRGLRNTAIISLLAFEGLKVREVIQLKWRHYMQRSKTLIIIGQKQRVLSLDMETEKHMLRFYKQKQTVSLDSYIFTSFQGRQAKETMKPLSRHGLKFMLYDLSKKINIMPVNTELMRHHAICFQLKKGFSHLQVQERLGLKQLGNIAKYQAPQNANNKEDAL